MFQSAATGQFTARFGMRSSAAASAIADVDGDGRPDIVRYSEENGTPALEVFINIDRGEPTFQLAPSALVGPAPSGVHQISAEDVDGDGDVDLLVADSRSIELWLNDGAGHLVQQPNVIQVGAAFGGTVPSFVLADLDGDGDRDLVATVGVYDGTRTRYQLEFHRRDGATQFTRVAGTFPGTTGRVFALDLDDDLDPEVYFAGSVWMNRLRHAVPTVVPRAGGLIGYELHVVGGGRVLPILSTALAPTPLATIAGDIRVDLSRAAFLPDLPTGAADIARIEAVMPDLPALVGIDLHLQAITWNGASYGVTNTVSQTVVR
jgi:hypothetical protein